MTYNGWLLLKVTMVSFLTEIITDAICWRYEDPHINLRDAWSHLIAEIREVLGEFSAYLTIQCFNVFYLQPLQCYLDLPNSKRLSPVNPATSFNSVCLTPVTQCASPSQAQWKQPSMMSISPSRLLPSLIQCAEPWLLMKPRRLWTSVDMTLQMQGEDVYSVFS